MLESLLVKAYSIPHSFEVEELIESYSCVLTAILDELWRNTLWKRRGKRVIPYIRKDKAFRKMLRDKYLDGWNYSKHYVDSAIKQAYSMLSSWRKRYLKGKAGRGKPKLKRKFVRIKETLYSYKDGVIRISIKPCEKSISIDLKKAWCWDKIKGLEIGELILKEGMLTVTVRKRAELKIKNPIAWDVNLLSLNGYDGEKDCSLSLKDVYTIHRTYELKRKKIQELPENTKKKLMAKYASREKNRVKNALHKLANELSNSTNIFEDLRHFKERVARTKSRSINRQNSKHNYIMLQRYVEYKSAWNGYATVYVDPKGTSKACSKCGWYNKGLKGVGVFKCKRCGLVIDRQRNASRNVWNNFLRMWGHGFALKGAKSGEKLPMNPEGDEGNEAQEQGMDSICIHT